MLFLLGLLIYDKNGGVEGPPYTTAHPSNAWGNSPVDDSWGMIFRIGTAIFHRDVAVTISIARLQSPLKGMELIQLIIIRTSQCKGNCYLCYEYFN